MVRQRGCDARVVITLSAALGVFAVALAMVLTPGPNMMYLVSRSITQGRRAGVISLFGVALGNLFYLTATNLGLSAMFVVVPEAYLAVKLAGAAYLGWLAVKALRGGVSVFQPTRMERDSPRRLFTMGLVTNLLNPKIAVMYLSLIPQFVRPGAGHVLLQGILLGAVQITVAFAVNLLIVLTAGTIAVFLAGRPVWLRAQRYFMGTVLGALAVRLATDHARPAPA
jgi:threonine/homoserine/homoserine lactone efflux protein